MATIIRIDRVVAKPGVDVSFCIEDERRNGVEISYWQSFTSGYFSWSGSGSDFVPGFIDPVSGKIEGHEAKAIVAGVLADLFPWNGRKLGRRDARR